MTYRIVQSKDEQEFAAKLNELEQEGWKLEGFDMPPSKYLFTLYGGLITKAHLYTAVMSKLAETPEPEPDPEPEPYPIQLLKNPSFEEGTYLQFPEHDNIEVPVDWKLWYTHGQRCCMHSEIKEGQPECGLIDRSVDALRVFHHDKAFKAHTYSRCMNVRLFQTVDVEPGASYEFSIYMHMWYSNCSTKPHATQPLHEDCVTPFAGAWHELRVGIDPEGNDDPCAGSIIWSAPREQYGFYTTDGIPDGNPFRVSIENATGSGLTVIASAWTSYALRHNDWYADYARLVQF